MSTELEVTRLPDRSVESLDVLAELRKAIVRLDDQRQLLAEIGEWERLVYGLDGLRVLIADLQTLARSVEDDAIALMPTKRVELEGLAAEKRSGSKVTHWDDDAVLKALLDKAEIGTPLELGREILRAGAVSYWRKGVLRELGVEPDELCDSTPGRPTLQLTRAGA